MAAQSGRVLYFGVFIASFIVGLLLLSVVPVFFALSFDFASSRWLSLLAPLYVLPLYFALWLPHRMLHRKMEDRSNVASGYKLSAPALLLSALHLLSAAFFYSIRCNEEVREGLLAEFPSKEVYLCFAYFFVLVAYGLLLPFIASKKSAKNLST